MVGEPIREHSGSGDWAQRPSKEPKPILTCCSTERMSAKENRGLICMEINAYEQKIRSGRSQAM